MNLISVVVITYNEEKNIARCLDSVKRIADEIIVLDACSTDKTVEIALSRGAIVKKAFFTGYIQQKNAAVAFASHDYILSLDADEALDEKLVAAILKAKPHFDGVAYNMNRCTNYCGKFIRWGNWYPDKKLRLFNRQFAHWGGSTPHEKIEFTGSQNQVQHLEGDILHFSFPTIQSHLQKSNKYSSAAAQYLFTKGKKSSWFKILINPFWEFFYGFFIRLGLLDGFYGFVISINNAHATFLKYSKLYQLQHGVKLTSLSPVNTVGSVTIGEQLNKVVHES